MDHCGHLRAAFTITLLFAASLVVAEERWTGSAGIALSGREVHGSEDSFRSQSDLRSGFSLDELTLQRSAGTTLSLRASGFGNAEPVSQARAAVRFRAPLTLALSYDRRQSFFALGAPSPLRHDDWSLARWNAQVGWDGWRAGRLTLDLRQTSRDGTLLRPFFGLNETYPLLYDLNQTTREARVRFQTRTLPMQLSIEQSFAHHARRDRARPAGGTADPDVLIGTSGRLDDRQNIPTSRVSATWGRPNLEAVATVHWTPVRLSAGSPLTPTFAIDGGNSGSVTFVDRVAGSATRDAFAGSARLAMRIAPRWMVRFSTDYRNASTDGSLLGQRLMRMNNPQGIQLELSAPLAAQRVFDFTDGTERLELENAGERLIIRAGLLATQRSVNGIDRRSTGETLSLVWRGARFSSGADFEHASLERYIFRTDPETVDRLHLRASAKLAGGWNVQGEGRFERSENPKEIAALDHRSHSGTLDLSWTAAERDASFGLSAGATKLRTRTDLVLPGDTSGTSDYDLALLSTTGHGRFAVGRYALSGSLTHTRDNGSTWPVGTWSGNVRATFQSSKRTSFGVFGEHWAYDERKASVDDFDVNRYGVVLLWRFE